MKITISDLERELEDMKAKNEVELKEVQE